MNPAVFSGIIFGILTILINGYIVAPIKNGALGVILISGLLFFNVLFSVLFTKKKNGYHLPWSQGMKSAVQSGIIQSVFYFLSIVLINQYISPNYFPNLDSWKQYLLNFNIYIILFSIFSAIFGFIVSTLFQTNK